MTGTIWIAVAAVCLSAIALVISLDALRINRANRRKLLELYGPWPPAA